MEMPLHGSSAATHRGHVYGCRQRQVARRSAASEGRGPRRQLLCMRARAACLVPPCCCCCCRCRCCCCCCRCRCRRCGISYTPGDVVTRGQLASAAANVRMLLESVVLRCAAAQPACVLGAAAQHAAQPQGSAAHDSAAPRLAWHCSFARCGAEKAAHRHRQRPPFCSAPSPRSRPARLQRCFAFCVQRVRVWARLPSRPVTSACVCPLRCLTPTSAPGGPGAALQGGAPPSGTG